MMQLDPQTYTGRLSQTWREGQRARQVVYVPNNINWTWKPLARAHKRQNQEEVRKMAEAKRSEAILRNLAQELLTDEECQKFKQALHHFRVSHSVASLCHQLKPVINTTVKILLLIELSGRIPRNLQEDYHRLCCLQYSEYESYLKLVSNGNTTNEIPKIIAQDSSGMFRIVSRGSEKKIMVKYNNVKNSYEVQSVHGTSVTSGVYSEIDDDDDMSDVFDGATKRPDTPTFLKDRKNVRNVFLKRHADGSLGLGIMGGKEYGTEIIINVVEEGGPAASVGLRPGDRVLEVNGTSFLSVTHAEAVTIMRNAWNLIMMIQSGPKDSFGAEFDPDFVRQVNLELVIYPSRNGKLGCTTQRLRNKELLVKEVLSNSPAQKGKMHINDIIFKIDGVSIPELSERQIVMLIDARRMVAGVRRNVIEKREHLTSAKEGQHERLNEYDSIESSSPQVKNDPHRDSGEFPPEKQRKINNQEHSEVDGARLSRRDHSQESRSSHPLSSKSRESSHDQENQSPHRSDPRADQPEHLVYGGSKPAQEGNWVISPNKAREHRYTQRKNNFIKDQQYYYMHPRTSSEGRYELRRRYLQKEPQDHGSYRYSRNRSLSPHQPSAQVRQIHHEDAVIRAIQQGLEKRQRAIRLAMYQMPDPVDYEWEI